MAASLLGHQSADYRHAGGSPFTEQITNMSNTVANTKHRNPTA
jgi:hypothetical protein